MDWQPIKTLPEDGRAEVCNIQTGDRGFLYGEHSGRPMCSSLWRDAMLGAWTHWRLPTPLPAKGSRMAPLVSDQGTLTEIRGIINRTRRRPSKPEHMLFEEAVNLIGEILNP